jgi:hypothetical protein
MRSGCARVSANTKADPSIWPRGKSVSTHPVPNLTDLPVKRSYRTGRDDLVRDFFVPCLEAAVLYRRAAAKAPVGAAPRRDGALLRALQERIRHLPAHGKASCGLARPRPGHRRLESGLELGNHAFQRALALVAVVVGPGRDWGRHDGAPGSRSIPSGADGLVGFLGGLIARSCALAFVAPRPECIGG